LVKNNSKSLDSCFRRNDNVVVPTTAKQGPRNNPRQCRGLTGIEAREGAVMCGRDSKIGQPRDKLGQPRDKLGQPRDKLGRPCGVASTFSRLSFVLANVSVS